MTTNRIRTFASATVFASSGHQVCRFLTASPARWQRKLSAIISDIDVLSGF